MAVSKEKLINILNLGELLYSQGRLKADLHGTTLSHTTSLRQAYDMT